MNKSFFFICVLSLLILNISLAYAWGCNNQHCRVTAPSIYYSGLDISRDPVKPNSSIVTYTLDLNMMNGILDKQGLLFFDDTLDWDDLIKVRSESRTNISYYGVYHFNNWWANKYMSVDDYYDYIQIQAPGDYLSLSGSLFTSTSYLGLPFYIGFCYIDCDYKGDESVCSNDGVVDLIFDYRNTAENSQVKTIYTDVVDTSGNYFLNQTYSELSNTPPLLIVDGKVRTTIVGKCQGDSKIRAGCSLISNPYYRHLSSVDIDWNYNEVISSFPTGVSNRANINDCFTLDVNMTAGTYNPSNRTVDQMISTYGIPEPVCTINSDGKRVCIYETAELGRTINSDMILQSAYSHVIKQAKSNSELLEMSNRLGFQYKSLQLLDTTASIIMLLYYVVILTLLSGLILVRFPEFLQKVLNIFREFGKIRRY